MRVAAIADVHGNAPALEAVLAELAREQPDLAYWALLGPDIELRRTAYDLDGAIERLRASGMPQLDRIEDLMRMPPSHAE